MTRLSTYRSRKLRERMRQESEIIGRDALRLQELAASIPAPDLDELRALEKGEVPLSLEAVWISVLFESSFWLTEASETLEGESERSRGLLTRSWYPGMRPAAKSIAHLRGGLRGRTLPENFLPQPRNVPLSLLLLGQNYTSRAGAALVTDLLIQGYKWED